jgi:pimeloyl-ACP methyl ester carboxylesterase
MEAAADQSVYTREDVEFTSHGTRCAAWLYRPQAENPPLVVMAHGLGAIRHVRLPAFAERFAAAGYAVLVFDYRYLGDSDGQPRQLLGLRAQRDDWHAALAYARTLPGIDHGRIAIWGTSLAGGHVISVAARDHGVAAVIAQCPFSNGPASVRALGVVGGLFATLFAIADLIAKLLRRGPVLVPLVGVRTTPALMRAPDVVGGVLEMLPEGSELSAGLSRFYRRFAAKRVPLPEHVHLSERPETLRTARRVGMIFTPDGGEMPNGVAARFGLTIGLDRPTARMRDIKCPALVCVCDRDSVAPPGPTTKAATEAGLEVRHYDAGHFDIYTGERFEQVVFDQIAFLHRHLD